MTFLPLKGVLRCLGAGLLFWAANGVSHADQVANPHLSADDRAVLVSSLKWQTGTITLKDGLAKLTLSDQFHFLDPEDAQKVMHQIWGNPADPNLLGMIFPTGVGPLDPQRWAVGIEYEEDGYIKDDDAGKIDYTALLKQMQQEALAHNDERQRLGYPTVSLVGWATPPHYDPATHKLYWAKEVHFGDDDGNTLNYNIRVLGRRGVLLLNAIAPMQRFAEVDAQMPQVLAMVDFQPGNLYSDFDPKVDKIATYGLATLIAGGALGVAAKVGAFKFLIPALLFLKKFIIIAVVAVVGLFKKIGSKFSGKPRQTPGSTLPPQQRP